MGWGQAELGFRITVLSCDSGQEFKHHSELGPDTANSQGKVTSEISIVAPAMVGTVHAYLGNVKHE